MTVLQAIASLIDAEWEPSISGRWNDVPKPKIVLEKEVTKEMLRTQDVLRVEDGGDTEKTPLGFGWTHEALDATVTISIRTLDRRIGGMPQDGRIRMFGERNGTDDAERYGGLAGELERICDANRKGFAEFDRVRLSPVRDESQLAPANGYRADLDIGLVIDAQNINPEP